MSDRINLGLYKRASTLFVLSAVVITLFLPRNGKFSYEFSMGKPWIHADLMAPFDFPIYKTDAELLEEYQQLKEKLLHYYNFDTVQGSTQLKLLRARLNSDAKERTLYKLLEPAFVYVYTKGIINEVPLLEGKEGDDVVAVVRNNVSRNCLIVELFTPITANSYIAARLSEDGKEWGRLAQSLSLSDYIHPNILYDNELTSQVHQTRMEAVLPTRGIVHEAEKIISKGEMVTPAAYQVLSSLRHEYEKNTTFLGDPYLLLLGRFLFVLSCLACVFALLVMFRREILLNNRSLLFTLMLIVTFVIAALLVLRKSPSLVYLVPFTIMPVYISVFFYSRPALYIHFFTMLLIANFTEASFEFVLLNSIAGVTAVTGFKRSFKRWQVFATTFLVFLSYSIPYMSLKLLQEGTINYIHWPFLLLFAVNSLLIIILFQFTFLFERLFGFVSNARLIELSDTNQHLLRELSDVAPGTFQHVMQVANLSEAIVREIGGDPLLVRVGALYHDIGKIKNSGFFIENQVSGFNPHSSLSPEESARIIIKHVTHGVELAQRYKLPKIIIDFIRTHHANSKVFYFYSKYLTDNPLDEEAVSKFSYPGPCPWTKEMAVVMMVDACEAASHSLKEPNARNIALLVDKVVGYQLSEGYLNEADITLREIIAVKTITKAKLRNLYHSRVEYPDRMKNEE